MQREHVPEKLLHGEIRLWNVSGPSDVGGVIVDNQIYRLMAPCSIRVNGASKFSG